MTTLRAFGPTALRTWNIVFCAVLLAGCGDRQNKEEQRQREAEPYIAGPEDIARASQGQIVTGATISGQLTADESATVRAQIAGQVTEVNGNVGQRVKQGDVVVRISAVSEREAVQSSRAAVETARTELELARRDEERTATLVKAGALAQRDLEQAQAATANARARLAQAQANLTAASEQLGEAVGRAPITGTISSIPVRRGDVVSIGAELFTVIDLSSLELQAAVPSDTLDRIQVGTPVQFQVQGYGDRQFTGRITRISPAVEPGTNQIQVYAMVPNVGGTLVSGLYAEGRIATGSREAVTVPSNAVTMQGREAFVTVVDRGRALRQRVEVGDRDQQTGTVQITSGLQPGETVLVGAARDVREGAPIEIRGEGRAESR